jgi:hypothetical protein
MKVSNTGYKYTTSTGTELLSLLQNTVHKHGCFPSRNTVAVISPNDRILLIPMPTNVYRAAPSSAAVHWSILRPIGAEYPPASPLHPASRACTSDSGRDSRRRAAALPAGGTNPPNCRARLRDRGPRGEHAATAVQFPFRSRPLWRGCSRQ